MRWMWLVVVSVLSVCPRSAVGTVRLRSPRAWIGRQRGGPRAPCRENSGLAALAVRTILLKFGTSSPYRSSLLYLTTCCRLSPTGARSVGAGMGGVRGGGWRGRVTVQGAEGRPVTAAGGEVQHSGQAWLRTAALPRCRSPGTGLLSGRRPDSGSGPPAACGYMRAVVRCLLAAGHVGGVASRNWYLPVRCDDLPVPSQKSAKARSL